MAKYVCSVCGYVYEGDEAPEQCLDKVFVKGIIVARF